MDNSKNSKLIVIVSFLVLILLSFIIINVFKLRSSSVLGDYHGISDDKRWETSFRVYKDKRFDNDIMVDGYVAYLDNIESNYKEKDIQNCHITGYQSDDKGSFDGNFIYSDNKYRILTFAANEKQPYYKMKILIGNDTTILKVSKVKNQH